MNRVVLLAFLLIIGINTSFGQDKKLDMLEVYYFQEHYKIVLKKSNKLIDNPDYDYTIVPIFYKAMALFQLNQSKTFRKRNKKSIQLAFDLWAKFRREDIGDRVFNAHIHEVVDLKQDLVLWKDELRNQKKNELAAEINTFLVSNFEKVENVEVGNDKVVDLPSEKEINAGSASKVRRQLIKYSKTLIGIKYIYGGIDKKGFDCSGFTSYVYKKFDVNLPRRATDQQAKSKKKKLKDAKVGDLVFFSNGGGVNHVGIIVSNKDGHPVMIHASTSQGIVETDIMSNSYWKPRFKYVGSYLD